jgi:agmatine deiminase
MSSIDVLLDADEVQHSKGCIPRGTTAFPFMLQIYVHKRRFCRAYRRYRAGLPGPVVRYQPVLPRAHGRPSALALARALSIAALAPWACPARTLPGRSANSVRATLPGVKTPAYRMPAEWQPHAATWLAWPCDDALWFGQLTAVRQECAALIAAISDSEAVDLLVRDPEALASATAMLYTHGITPNTPTTQRFPVRLHHCPYNDIWLRDSGPMFVYDHAETPAKLLGTDWIFNGWGNKFSAELDNQIPSFIAKHLGARFIATDVVMEGGGLEVNGHGSVLTTRQCLLSPQRNPELSQTDIEAALATYLGAEQVLWLDEGLENDHTDGHIDTITRFVSPDTIVTVVGTDPNDFNTAVGQANLERLRSFYQPNGLPWNIIELPLPKNRLELDGERLPPTYANFYICNNQVLVPQYHDPHDPLALEILAALFPSHQVRGLSARAIILGGGAFHCITQQQPVGVVA